MPVLLYKLYGARTILNTIIQSLTPHISMLNMSLVKHSVTLWDYEHGFSGPFGLNGGWGTKFGRGGAMLTPTNSFFIYFWGFLRLWQFFCENRLQRCDCESAHRRTHTHTDIRKPVFYLSHAICYSYRADKDRLILNISPKYYLSPVTRTVGPELNRPSDRGEALS